MRALTDIEGASSVIEKAFVTYSDKAKMDLLGVRQETLEKYGAVSSDVAGEMAMGLHKMKAGDICISCTGLAGPTGDGMHEIGTVFIGIMTSRLASPEVFEMHIPPTSRDVVREKTILRMMNIALNTV